MSRPRLAKIEIASPRRPWSRSWQAPVLLLGAIFFALVAGTASWRADPQLALLRNETRHLRQGLASKEKGEKLLAHAENLLALIEIFPDRAGEIYFLAGSAYLRLAEETRLPNEIVALRNQAIGHLEKAENAGVHERDRANLLFRLGWALYHRGDDAPRAIRTLSQGIEAGADGPSVGYAILVQAYLNLPEPDLDAALIANQKQLEAYSDDEDMLHRARLIRGELFYRKDNRQEALKVLDRIGPNAPGDIKQQARFLQARICEEEKLWRRAIPYWRELLDDAGHVPGGKARILYALGMCHYLSAPPDYELASQHWQEAAAFGGDEGQAAALRLGELSILVQPDLIQTSLLWWSKALEPVQAAGDYRNPYFEIAKLREMMERSCRKYLDLQQYPAAQQIAVLYRKVAEPGQADAYLAQAAETLAKRLHEAQRGELTTEIRQQYFVAGDAYEASAKTRPPHERPAWLWRAAECYRQGRDPTRIVAAVEKVLQVETDEMRQAEAWLLLAENLHALKQKEKAWQAYIKCIEIPNTPFQNQARYALAQEQILAGNRQQAKEILEQSLTSTLAVADRKAHESSLYTLGQLLFQDHQYELAYLRLKQATWEYPSNPQVWKSRDQLAECYRRLAETAGKRLVYQANRETDENKIKEQQERNKYFRLEMLKWHNEARDAYQKLADDLELAIKENEKLPSGTLVLLPKSLFSVADIFYEMNELEEALRRYQQLQQMYRQKVEGLIACHRIWSCVGRVVQPPERVQKVQDLARVAMAKAKEDLAAMSDNDEAFRGHQGVWTRQRWNDWLSVEVEPKLNPVSPGPRPSPVVPSLYQK